VVSTCCELKNMVERAIIISEGDILKLEDFRTGTKISSTKLENIKDSQEIWDLELAEKILIKNALEKSNNNKSKAADLLKISWQSLDRRMKKFELS